ncbi:Zn-finger domain of CDGSH type-containing protein [Streptosporangium subroseum]|uniref:Zn-finger domain of CDGSH type-containing protein n=1 Tax=Streptosporangium subroseum TaxID=106412 RepID=A0A239H3U8_9ACTN|nr:ferritin-like domain-containing protein [Streptosporangium subroseum]SNS74934.1 Zn-finger domain of CDGSH type-containing protein [Streptosporangium subroseum]
MKRSRPQELAVPDPSARIVTLDSLREHLQWAIELEHATLPPYLYALYSLDPERNPEAVEVVGGVFIEEMLHLALAANLLNAVGGRPRLDTLQMLPPHPRRLPHGDRSLEVALVPFGPEALEMFLRLERPAPPGGPAEGEDYETIGQFYAAIEQGLRRLSDTLGEGAVFSGDPARQVSAAHFRHTAGHLVAVGDLDSALAALREIVEQGEGSAGGGVWDGEQDVFHPEREEVAHYYRFQELKAGRRYRRGDTPRSGPTGEPISVDWAGVRPMRHNPRLDDHAVGSAIRTAQEEFNHTYCAVLHLLEQAFNGSPNLLAVATGTMYALKAQTQALSRMPDENGTTAGPTFDYVAPELRRWSVGDRRRIVVLHDGPYVVYGGIPLRRKRKIVSAENDALTWKTDEPLATEDTYALCRCGRSSSKPFCDGTHAVVGFDGTETASERPYRELQHVHDGVGISAQRVGELCIHAAFCVGRARPIAAMLADTGDSDVRSDVMGRIDHCPSGSYSYALQRDGEVIEPDLPQAISVLGEEDGLASALWVTGGVPVLRADGRPLETRNRMTLCRCGHSGNKPLCDGTHREIGFREETPEAAEAAGRASK